MKTSMTSVTGVIVLASALSLGVLVGACGGESPGANTAGAGAAGGKAHELVGNPAPAFAADTVNGKGKVDMKALAGKVVVVDFWATWCEPCKKSFPKLQELNVKYKANGVQIVGISQDDENQGLTDFGKSYGADFPLLWDKDKNIAKQYKPASMPASFIVDKQGVVRFAHLGYHDGDEALVEKEIKSLL